MYKPGEKFLSDSDRNRMALQDRWERIYHSQEIFVLTIGKDGTTRKVDPLIPVASTISEINADLLFGQFPEFDFQDEAVDELVQSKLPLTFQTETLDAATYLSAIGTLFLHMFMMDGKVYWKWIPSNSLTWESDIRGLTNVRKIDKSDEENASYDVYDIQEHRFIYNPLLGSPYRDQNRRYVIETYRVYVSKIDGKVARVSPISGEETDLDFLPFIRIDNSSQLVGQIGRSDYQGKEQVFAEIDNRVDQINAVLYEHAEPWIGLPPGVLDEQGHFNRSMGKMFEQSAVSQQNQITIATWDASLEAAFKSIDTMIELLLFSTRISPALAGYQKGGYADSGRALKWRTVQTWSMVKRKQVAWTVFFNRFFTFWKAMDPELKDVDVTRLIIRWEQGLPFDDEAQTDEIVKLVNAGIMSKLEAIQRAQDLDPDKAQAELDQINAEHVRAVGNEAAAFQPANTGE